jgi:hypothetical protein
VKIQSMLSGSKMICDMALQSSFLKSLNIWPIDQ